MVNQTSASLEAAIVARRFFIDGQQKSEIATDLGISRFKVARLLDEAQASGIVKIHIAMPADINLSLGEQVAKKFGISRALVVECLESAPDAILGQIGTAGANYLSSIVSAADVIGISWGRTLDAVFDEVKTIAKADVVQLVGGLQNDDIEVGGVELARNLSSKTGGKVYPLHAPMLVGSEDLAIQLRKDSGLKPTIEKFKDVTIAVVGIGSWSPETSALHSSMNNSEQTELTKLKAAGDICASVFDHDGTLLTSSALNKTVAIKPAELKKIPEVIAVAGGAAKHKAIAAALKTGLVSTLITDSITASKLLKAKD